MVRPDGELNRRGTSFERRSVSRGGRRATDRPGHYPTVVIAESYEAVRSLCARYLTRFGFRVEQASNGVEALATIRQSLPQVVLAEPRLPLLSAERLAHSLAQDASTRTIPIILLAATPHITEASDRFQPAAVLQKPFLFTRMLDEVRRVLRARLASL